MDDDDEYLMMNLPKHLNLAISQLLEGQRTNSSLLDCLMDEVYGSLNSAEIDGEITSDLAWYLRRKYLGMGNDD